MDVKNSYSVNSFKVNLEYFKKDCIKKGNYCDNHYWKVSDEVISRNKETCCVNSHQDQ